MWRLLLAFGHVDPILAAIPRLGDIQKGVKDESEGNRFDKGVNVSPADVSLEAENEIDLVERWRAQELERAGYDLSAVAVLAASPQVDLHLAIDLLVRGCPQDTAVQILL
jgi:hypothetical protein